MESKNSRTIKDQLRRFVADNKMDVVLGQLRDLHVQNDDFQNELAMHERALKEIKRSERLGILSTSEIVRRNAALADALLTLISAMPESAKRCVFISYSHSDSEMTSELAEMLQTDGIDVIIDIYQIKGGQQISDFILESIRKSDVVLSIVSRNSLFSDWVAFETIQAFNAEVLADNKRFVACFTEGVMWEPGFIEEAIQILSNRKSEIQHQITLRLEQNKEIDDLYNDLNRASQIEFNLPRIIQRLKESLCIDIGGDKLKSNYGKILESLS